MASPTLQELFRSHLGTDPSAFSTDELIQMLANAGVPFNEITAARAVTTGDTVAAPTVATPTVATPTVDVNTSAPTSNALTDALKRNGVDRSYMQYMSDSDLLDRLSTVEGNARVQHSLGTRTPVASSILKPEGATADVKASTKALRSAVGNASTRTSRPTAGHNVLKAAYAPYSSTASAATPGNAVSGLDTGASTGASTSAQSGGLFAPGFTEKLKTGAGGLMSPQFDWNKSSGLQGWGKDLGGYMNIANTAIQGLNAAQGLGDIADAQRSGGDLQSDILVEAMNNPMASYDLSSDQQRLLDKLRNGSYNSEIGLDDVNLLGALGNAGMGALTGAGGGIPGMIIGGLGGLINSGIGDIASAQNRSNAELQALYTALQESNQNYRNMRRQRMMANF